MKVKPMTKFEFLKRLEILGMSQEEFADLVGVSIETIKSVTIKAHSRGGFVPTRYALLIKYALPSFLNEVATEEGIVQEAIEKFNIRVSNIVHKLDCFNALAYEQYVAAVALKEAITNRNGNAIEIRAQELLHVATLLNKNIPREALNERHRATIAKKISKRGLDYAPG